MASQGNSKALKAKAVTYIRTSSAANVGVEKDSDKRQRHAIAAFAKRAGLELVGEFNDAAVSGADHIETRPGFVAMLAYVASNGARTIIVETASRFARDLMVQEVGFAKLQALGIKLVAADSPQSFLDDTPTSKLIRQILGAVSEFDKAMVVAKLKGARERKRVITGKKVEGRKSHAELSGPGPSASSQETEGWSAITAGNFSGACGSWLHERARERLQRGKHKLDAVPISFLRSAPRMCCPEVTLPNVPTTIGKR